MRTKPTKALPLPSFPARCWGAEGIQAQPPGAATPSTCVPAPPHMQQGELDLPAQLGPLPGVFFWSPIREGGANGALRERTLLKAANFPHFESVKSL